MKKIYLFGLSLAIGISALSSCGKKNSPEDEVRSYGKYFIEKLAANQMDSLKASYPDIVKADSFVPLESDTIIVVETAPGQYDMALAQGVTLKVNRSDDGSIFVTESKGLFAFPDNKLDIARETGMWDANISDAQLNERMKDEEFFKMMEKKSNINPNNIISVGKVVSTSEWSGFDYDDSGTGYFPLKNNTDMAISGADYQVVIRVSDIFSGESWSYTEPGKDLAPNGSARINVRFRPKSNPERASIKFKISESDLKAKFSPDFTGREYQEYLDSKK